MIEAFLLSVQQLSDRKIWSLLAKVVLLTLLVVISIGWGIYYLAIWSISQIDLDDGSWLASLGSLITLFATLIAIIGAFLLFRIVAIFVINIFSDDVVDVVEKKYYPARAERARPPSYGLGLRMGLASAMRVLGYNLFASPLYIGLLITGIGTAAAFFAVNAVLIGRDMQDMVASRHTDDFRQIESHWQLPKLQRFGLGLITALLLAVPFVNFLAPIVGAAMATHLMHRQQEEEASP